MSIQNARDQHEQATVANYYEIRRVTPLVSSSHRLLMLVFDQLQRDALIASLQERVAELESTLAHRLQPADVFQSTSTIFNLAVSAPTDFSDPTVRSPQPTKSFF